MSTSSRRRSGYIVEGHEFAGWIPAEQPSDEAKEKIELLSEALRTRFDPATRKTVEETLGKLEGELVPMCACGWRGYAEPWVDPLARSRGGGQQHIQHKHFAQVDRIQQQFAADTAAAALRHAAESWTGNDEVRRWLEERAEHIKAVGMYDGERWP